MAEPMDISLSERSEKFQPFDRSWQHRLIPNARCDNCNEKCGQSSIGWLSTLTEDEHNSLVAAGHTDKQFYVVSGVHYMEDFRLCGACARDNKCVEKLKDKCRTK